MEIKPLKGPVALSHSRLSDYVQCPRKFYVKYIEKDWPQESDSPHLIRGSNVHKALENYIIGKTMNVKGLPVSSLSEVENTKPFIDKIISQFEIVHPEIQLAVDKDFNKVEWFAKNAYYRAILDLLAINPTQAFMGDFKTGKMNDYSGFGGQLHLAAAMVMSILPTIERVAVAYIYVDHKQIFKLEFTRADLPDLLKYYHDKYAEVNADKEFSPKINEYCKWCDAKKNHCPYSRKL